MKKIAPVHQGAMSDAPPFSNIVGAAEYAVRSHRLVTLTLARTHGNKLGTSTIEAAELARQYEQSVFDLKMSSNSLQQNVRADAAQRFLAIAAKSYVHILIGVKDCSRNRAAHILRSFIQNGPACMLLTPADVQRQQQQEKMQQSESYALAVLNGLAPRPSLPRSLDLRAPLGSLRLCEADLIKILQSSSRIGLPCEVLLQRTSDEVEIVWGTIRLVGEYLVGSTLRKVPDTRGSTAMTRIGAHRISALMTENSDGIKLSLKLKSRTAAGQVQRRKDRKLAHQLTTNSL